MLYFVGLACVRRVFREGTSERGSGIVIMPQCDVRMDDQSYRCLRVACEVIDGSLLPADKGSMEDLVEAYKDNDGCLDVVYGCM